MFRLSLKEDEHGAIAVIVALSMTVVLAMAALVVDIGATQSRRAQLQEAADSAALGIAQQCAKAGATTLASCSSSVLAAASTTATQLGIANLDDASVGMPVFTSSTVKVTATSTQVGIFSGLFTDPNNGLTATATAKWSPPVTPLPLAYQECALPAASASTKVFLRTDALKVLGSLSGCGVIGSVLGVLGGSWAVADGCTYDIDLLTYVGGVLSNALPSECVSMVGSLVGKEVVVPVYSRVLGPIVVNGVLLGNGYAIEKYALIQLTGYDFQSVNLFGVPLLGGPKSMPGDPQCPTLLGIEEPLCQGLQGYLVGYLTPAEAKQRIAGVQLIA